VYQFLLPVRTATKKGTVVSFLFTSFLCYYYHCCCCCGGWWCSSWYKYVMGAQMTNNSVYNSDRKSSKGSGRCCHSESSRPPIPLLLLLLLSLSFSIPILRCYTSRIGRKWVDFRAQVTTLDPITERYCVRGPRIGWIQDVCVAYTTEAPTFGSAHSCDKNNQRNMTACQNRNTEITAAHSSNAETHLKKDGSRWIMMRDAPSYVLVLSIGTYIHSAMPSQFLILSRRSSRRSLCWAFASS